MMSAVTGTIWEGSLLNFCLKREAIVDGVLAEIEVTCSFFKND
jgi:hypothetical protein